MSAARGRVVRWVLLALVIGAIYAVGRAYNLQDKLNVLTIQTWVEAAGVWGGAAYIGTFIGGVLLSVPGLVFITAGLVAFGPWPGIPLAFLGSILSATASVWVLARVGGAVLEDSEHPFLRRYLDGLNARPIRTIALLRLVLMISVFLNAPLAMAGVKPRENALGTAIGITPVILVVAFATDFILSFLQ